MGEREVDGWVELQSGEELVYRVPDILRQFQGTVQAGELVVGGESDGDGVGIPEQTQPN